jgi:hypothetical protein
MSGFNNQPGLVQGLADNLAQNISGIISTKQTAKYASGARTVLKINGKPCGFAFGVSWRINTTVSEIMTIDDYMPAELVPQRISVEGTISALHIPGQGVGVQLWQPDALNFLFQQYITIEVRDSATDQLLFFTARAMITSRAEELRVDSLANVTLSFKAIGFQDERVPQQADDVNGAQQTTSAFVLPNVPSRLDEIPFNPTSGVPTLTA